MKKDAYYFPHDCTAKDDPKCVNLIEELGLEGYGAYWVLIEILREQPDFKYPLKLISSIARRYNTNIEIVSRVINEFELFNVEGETFFSNSLIERMTLINYIRAKRSESGKIANNIRWAKIRPSQNSLNPIPIGSQSDPNRTPSGSQEKESKVNESKVNLFTKPSLKDIESYCNERNNNINPKYFFDSNEAKGWLVGKNRTPMKDWKAAIRTWEANSQSTNNKLGIGEFINERGQRTYGTDAIVPDSAPPRPSDNHYWHKSANEWRRS